MDAFNDPQYKTIAALTGSQMGKSEAILCILGKMFDDGPRVPALLVQPTEKLARSFSNDRLSKMFTSCKSLSKKIAKGQKNKVIEKFIAGIRLGIAWAGSATEMASHPCGLVVLDEVDRMSANVGQEGDPVMLARARLKNFNAGKLGLFSTPTTEKSSKIYSIWLDGTKGKWSWCCIHCNVYFIVNLERLKWPKKATLTQAYNEAYVECPNCKGKLLDRHKEKMNESGRYEYHRFLDGTGEEPELEMIGPVPEKNPTASMWVSGIASPWQKLGELAQVILTAYRSKDPETIKACLNTFFGELYKESTEDAPKWNEIRGLIKMYEPGSLPEDVQVITLGADVQKMGIYYTIRGWGFNSESWKLAHGFVPGETEFPAVWSLFSKIINSDFEGMKIKRAFVDSGFNTNQVYLFARLYKGTVFPTKGQPSLARPVQSNKVDVSAAGRILKGGVTLFHLHTDYFKTFLYSRLRWPEGEPGGFNLDSGTDDDYLKQITAEELLILSNGNRKWLQIRPDNHYLDCEVNALGAASSLQVHTLKKKMRKQIISSQGKKKSFVNAPDNFIKKR